MTQALARRLHDVLPAGVPLLAAGTPGLVALSREACACVLAAMFLCALETQEGGGDYPFPSFAPLLASPEPQDAAKLAMYLNYFARLGAPPLAARGTVYVRRCVADAVGVSGGWGGAEEPVLPMEVLRGGRIEDVPDAAHTDFANECIGGGALSGGCVQEEIMFACSPELAASLLFCAVMRPNEAIVITGAERFSSYTGYGRSLRFGGEFVDSRPRLGAAAAARGVDADSFATCVIAIDALPTPRGRLRSQYSREYIARELLKAAAGFGGGGPEWPPARGGRIATGKWGCGAFGGEPQLKAVVQWLAASRAGRPLVFCVFDGFELVGELQAAVAAAVARRATVGAVFAALMAYVEGARAEEDSLLAHIRRKFE